MDVYRYELRFKTQGSSTIWLDKLWSDSLENAWKALRSFHPDDQVEIYSSRVIDTNKIHN